LSSGDVSCAHEQKQLPFLAICCIGVIPLIEI
jgi:hypothetical protein